MNSPQSSKYLILYALIVTPIVVSFFFLRKGSEKPVRLNMHGQLGKSDPPAPSGAPGPTANSGKALQKNPGPFTRDSAQAPGAEASSRSLNVFFNWNGHTWDAYEVLGLPAGSSFRVVEDTWQRLREHGDCESVPFYQAAFEAIKATSEQGS